MKDEFSVGEIQLYHLTRKCNLCKRFSLKDDPRPKIKLYTSYVGYSLSRARLNRTIQHPVHDTSL